MKHYNHEAESIILCAMMIDRTTVERLSGYIQATDFDRELHRKIYEDIQRLHKSGALCDARAVITEFTRRGENQHIADIADISGATPSAGNVDYYVGVVKDLALKRETWRISQDAIDRLNRQEETGAAISGDVERKIAAVNLGACGNEYRHISRYLGEAAEELDHAAATMGEVRGIVAPFDGLSEITDFRNSEYIVIASRPSMGKTALALNMIETIAVRRKIPTGLFSVEMTCKQLNLRLIAAMCRINSWGLTKGLYKSPRDRERILGAMYEIGNAPLFVDETSSIRLSEFKTKARRMVRVDGCKILFLDYIGLLNAEQPKLPRHEQIAEISRTIKALAKELDVPIVALSQLTRDVEGKRPTLNSLAETRSIEQDADVIAFIHRERLEDMSPDRKAELEDAIPTELIVAKNRNGPTGVCNLIYKPRLTKFYDVANSEAEK